MKWNSILSVASIVNLSFLALIFALGTWVAEDYPITTLIAYIPPIFWLIPLLILIPFCLGRKNRTWLKVNAGALMLFGWLLMGINIPFGIDRSASEGSFSLMTFNMMSGSGGFEKVLQIINQNNPDIICLQEGSVLGLNGFENSQIPGYNLVNNGGVVVASKEKPISTTRVELFPGSPGGTEVEFANGLKVVAVHMSFHKFETVTKKGIPVHLQQVAKMHDFEVDILARRYAGRPKVIIAGDFNCPPRGHVYSKMRRHFTDAFAAGGWLTGYTWPSSFPIQRIDFAFTTDVKVQSARTISSTVSNHLPVLFRFKI